MQPYSLKIFSRCYNMAYLTNRCIVLLISLLLCSPAFLKSIRRNNISKHPVVIVVSYDGLRHDYFEKTDRTPWLHILKQTGIKVPYMEPVFPTSTFPNHQSIATGVFPEIHGIIDNDFFDPYYNRSMTGFVEDPEYWNFDSAVTPLWTLNELAGDERYSGCYMWPGCSVGYGPANKLPTFNVTPQYDESVPWSERVDTVLSWITNETTPANLVFMYFSQPDNSGHGFGPYSNRTLEEVENTDSRTAYLVGRLIEYGLYDKVNLIFLSDHGMEEVVKERIIPFVEVINSTGLIENIYGSTPVFHVVSKPGLLNDAFNAINQLCDSFRCNATNNAVATAPFYGGRNRRMSDFTVVAQPGYVFDDYGNFKPKANRTVNETATFGVHGYINTAFSMKPFFVAYGPAFRRGQEVQPFKNVDIFPLVSEIIGLPTVPSNGSISNVKDMLQQATTRSGTGGSSGGNVVTSAINNFLTCLMAMAIVLKMDCNLI